MQPFLVDINMNDYTIDPNKVEDAIKTHQKNNKRVKSIIELIMQDIHVIGKV